MKCKTQVVLDGQAAKRRGLPPGARCWQSGSASEWDVMTLAVEDRRCGCSASICHLVKDRTYDCGAFRTARRECLEDHLVEMILAPLKLVTEVVVPRGVMAIAHEMELCAHNAKQTD